MVTPFPRMILSWARGVLRERFADLRLRNLVLLGLEVGVEAGLVLWSSSQIKT